MRVFTIFFLVFGLGVMTSHLAEGLKKEKSSKNPSKVEKFEGIVKGLQLQRQFTRLPSKTGDPPKYKKTAGTPIITKPEGQEQTPEQTCAQQLSKALEDMGLGNLIQDSLNKEMAQELEDQLIKHFEEGAKRDDFLMNYGEFRKAQKNLGEKEPFPVRSEPEKFDMGPVAAGENPNANTQRRCSKRCLWMYGYYMTRVVVQDTQIMEDGKKNEVEATLVDERLIAPITLGKITKKNKCYCETTAEFNEQAVNYNIKIKRFNDLKRISSKAAMTYMEEQIGSKKGQIKLLDHETFLELVLFEILKHVREGRGQPDVVQEVRAGVLAGEEDYKHMMLGGTDKALTPTRSFRKLLSSKSWSLTKFLSNNYSKLRIPARSPDRKKF